MTGTTLKKAYGTQKVPTLHTDETAELTTADGQTYTNELKDEANISATELMRPVSLALLTQVFRMDKVTVRKRLAPCPTIGRSSHGVVWDFKQAASYLVEPRIDISAYIKTMRPQDLPPLLQDSYWSAMRKRQEWEVRAGHLWHTDDVLAVFGELAMTLKSTISLWVENLDRIHGLTKEQRQTMSQQSDNLLEEIFRLLVNEPSKKRTESSIASFEREDAFTIGGNEAPTSGDEFGDLI